jgi:hypothetical protein
MQRILNYGSSLQAYGLSRLLSDLDESVDVSFVDYVPGAVLVEDPQGTSRATRLVRKVVEHARGDASIADKMRFFNHKRRYAGRNFPLLGIPRDRNHDLNLDVEVIGSDEVFNCIQASSNVGYSPDLFGRGTSARRVVSYAASFGNTTLSRIEAAGIGDTLKRDLSSFHEISVRDRNSYEIVSALTGRPPPIHVDPVLAYDFMGLERRVPLQRLCDDRYVVAYAYPGRLSREENVALAAFARSIGARVLCFGGAQSCGDRFVDCDPFELLAYFRDAEAVFTDTFHGTILAIINERPFATAIRRSPDGATYGNEEKLGFLLSDLRLEDRAVEDPGDVSAVLSREIDFEPVRIQLSEERRRTSSYLTRVVLGSDVRA